MVASLTEEYEILTLFRMGDRIYADRMGGGGKNYPPP